MRSIAQEAGVSVMTVSRVLGGGFNVNPETAGHVRAVADRLGYHRNALVSTVMSSMRGSSKPACSHIIAYLTVHSSHFTPEMVLPSNSYFEGAKQRAKESGFDVELFEIRPPEMDSARISKILHTRNIRGILVGPLCRGWGHLSLNWKEFSTAAISINLVKPSLNRCCADTLQATSTALRNLQRLGYRRPGMALPPFYEVLNHYRQRAAYLNTASPRPSTARLAPLNAWSLEGFEKWLNAERPDVVIGHGTEVLAWMNELGLRIPEDIGYVELELLDETNPPTAGVAFDLGAVGAAAANLVISDLLRNVTGIPRHPLSIFLQGEWRAGPSVTKQSLTRSSSKSPVKKRVSRLAPKHEEPFPLAAQAPAHLWQPINLARVATHPHRSCRDINAWEQGLGLDLPPGRSVVRGSVFQLLDEKRNSGKSYILLRRGGRLKLSISDRAQALYFLLVCGWIDAHAPIAQFHFSWADGGSQSSDLIAYYRNPVRTSDPPEWTAESGIQDWWPSFPIFSNDQARPCKCTGPTGDPADWRYVYCWQWKNPRPEYELKSVVVEHAADCGKAVLGVLAASILRAE